MSAVVTPTPRPFAPRPIRWTATEFNHLGDMGGFEGRRAFLIDGVVWENGPMDLPHTVALGLVEQAIRAAFGPGWWVRGQSPLHVDEHNDPLPDFAVVRGGPRDYRDQQPATAALVVEIADSSLATDVTVKAERYAVAGISDYWVLDLDGRRLLVFRNPTPLPAGLGATAYRTHLTFGPAEKVAPLAAPNSPVTVSGLLP